MTFARPSCNVEFIDAYQNVIIVKEVLGDKIVSYWVLRVIYDPNSCSFFLDYFPVNPRVDNAFTRLPSDVMITRILELDVNG